MKLGPVTKPDTKKKATLNKINDDVMSENSDVIGISTIYSQFGAIHQQN